MTAELPPEIDGYLVSGTVVLKATIKWSSPVDEPPTVTAGGRTFEMDYWRSLGYEWADIHSSDLS